MSSIVTADDTVFIDDNLDTENFDNNGYESTSSLDSSAYEDELHMAAMIGKKLLDRNSELEHQLALSSLENQEQAKEIQLLAKQIAELRESENIRALTYEQWDLARLQVCCSVCSESFATKELLNKEFASNVELSGRER